LLAVGLLLLVKLVTEEVMDGKIGIYLGDWTKLTANVPQLQEVRIFKKK